MANEEAGRHDRGKHTFDGLGKFSILKQAGDRMMGRFWVGGIL